MAFYPAFLDLAQKNVLIVGGGEIALQKARSLAECGARLTVVAPRLKPGFPKGHRYLRRRFKESDLAARPWLVVAATDDEKLHARIARLCRARRLWVNVVDRPKWCDFIVPAVVRRGILTIAVSTGGASPALAKFVGERLRGILGPEYVRLGGFLKRLRPRLMALPMEERKTVIGRFLTPAAVQRLTGAPARRRWEKAFAAALKK